MADSSTIIRILNELSGNESEGSYMEVEQIVDSDEDPDYVPYEHNLQIEVSEIIRNIENPPIPPKICRKRKNISTSETDNNGLIEQECDINKFTAMSTIFGTHVVCILGLNSFYIFVPHALSTNTGAHTV